LVARRGRSISTIVRRVPTIVRRVPTGIVGRESTPRILCIRRRRRPSLHISVHHIFPSPIEVS
jgi:hypothetical protein